MPLVQHDDVAQAVPANRGDQPLEVGILPGGARRGESSSKGEERADVRGFVIALLKSCHSSFAAAVSLPPSSGLGTDSMIFIEERTTMNH